MSRHVRCKPDCIEHTYAGNQDGYAQVRKPEFSRTKKVLLHRWVYAQKHGVWPKVVRHTCDNPYCINPDHLIGGDHADNMRDRIERLGKPIGYPSKFSEDEITDIRTSGISGRALAAKYGVSESYISDIRAGRRGGHVQRSL